MKRMISGLLAACLCAALFCAPVLAKADALGAARARALAYLVEAKPILSEKDAWPALAAARSDGALPRGYFAPFAARLAETVRESGGTIHAGKPGENAFAALALTAIGENAANFAGYDLLAPLSDVDLVTRSGAAGAAYALVALDSGGYATREDDAPESVRERLVSYLLAAQNADGGFGGRQPGEAEITAIVLQALAPYRADEAVASSVSRGLDALSGLQGADGGFLSKGAPSACASAQVILALCALDVAQDDARFVKNGTSALDALLACQMPDGSFRSVEPARDLVSALALLALSGVERQESGKKSVFSMTDAERLLTPPQPQPPVTPRRKENEAARFSDTAGHPYERAMQTLAAYGIVSGHGGRFSPEEAMTRAQFAQILVGGLGLTPEYRGTFTDVLPQAWYAGAVDTAAAYGIVTGTGDGKFSPEDTVTRQEAAAMLARAAKLCGFDAALSEQQTAQILAYLPDGGGVSDYARGDVALCAQYALLPADWTELRPKRAVLRGEVAQMMYLLLTQAGLLL